eukprot:1458116-Pyramimonas_sp.AAC.1
MARWRGPVDNASVPPQPQNGLATDARPALPQTGAPVPERQGATETQGGKGQAHPQGSHPGAVTSHAPTLARLNTATASSRPASAARRCPPALRRAA